MFVGDLLALKLVSSQDSRNHIFFGVCVQVFMTGNLFSRPNGWLVKDGEMA